MENTEKLKTMCRTFHKNLKEMGFDCGLIEVTPDHIRAFAQKKDRDYCRRKETKTTIDYQEDV